MKKILLTALLLAPVMSFAQTGTTTATSTTVVTGTTTAATTTQVMCVSAALEKRENALIGGHDVFAGAVKAALQKRLAGLKDAWSQTDKKVKQEKQRTTWKTFRTDTQAAHTAMKTVRQSAWKAYDTDMRACGVRGHGEGPQSVQMPSLSL